MTDEELERLKKLVAEEEQRRRLIREQKDKLNFIKKGFGLQHPNGWCRHMKIKIIQDVDMLQGVDGNGGIKHEHYEANIDNEEHCELLFKAFEIIAETLERNIDYLDCVPNNATTAGGKR